MTTKTTYETAVPKQTGIERAVSFERADSGRPKIVIDESLPVTVYLAVGNGEPKRIAETTLSRVDALFDLLLAETKK